MGMEKEMCPLPSAYKINIENDGKYNTLYSLNSCFKSILQNISATVSLKQSLQISVKFSELM